MPTWLAIALGALLVLVVSLAVAGMAANARRHRERGDSFDARLADVNRALAAARATDRGWEPVTVETAARNAFVAERPGTTVREVTLVQVVDLPGTDGDKAVFRVVTAEGHEATLRLGRRDGEWVLDALE
jgi:hypothetical protein